MRLVWIRFALALGVLLAATLAPAKKTPTNPPADPGALIRMTMRSTVAVLLDEIPAGPLREQAAQEALAQSASFWTERAERQVRLTYYRLIYRGLFYSGAWSANPQKKGPLPLPPREVWSIEFSGPARRMRIGTHDLVGVDYSFLTHLLSDTASAAATEPRLGSIGGTWDESFDLPADPELLLERTGYACMDENEYPPGSVFEENTWYFYDDTCRVESPASPLCHITTFPTESCREALTRHAGIIRTAMHFERVPWNASTASAVRVGEITNPDGADLAVVTDAMQDEHRFVYRYFSADSCELQEGVIAAPGWRHLLAFSAVARNDGTAAVHIGDVTDPSNPWVQSRAYEYSPCHGHYHFSHYGVFGYAGAPGSKRAFCLEDTNRFHNDETTPLTAVHQSCTYQGIGAGWGDEYEFGIPGQWVDITEVDATSPHDLTFDLNPDAFLCEGQLVLDGSGNPILFDSGFTDPFGQTVYRLECDSPATWDANNVGSISTSSATGSFVTEPCTRGQIGPLRSCGFTSLGGPVSAPGGTTIHASCASTGAPQVLRVCETSDALGIGIPCTAAESRANVVVGNAPAVFSFVTPLVRDSNSSGGGYAVFQAPVLPSDSAAAVQCTWW